MIGTEFLLTAIGGHLAAVGLAQWSNDGTYLNHPDLPAVLLADADAPDTCILLSVLNVDPSLGDWDIEFTFRTTGIAPTSVDTLADNVFDYFDATLGLRAATYQAGTAVVMPSLVLPGALQWTGAERLTRGIAETTSEAKHKGRRWVRRDVWRVTVHPE